MKYMSIRNGVNDNVATISIIEDLINRMYYSATDAVTVDYDNDFTPIPSNNKRYIRANNGVYKCNYYDDDKLILENVIFEYIGRNVFKITYDIKTYVNDNIVDDTSHVLGGWIDEYMDTFGTNVVSRLMYVCTPVIRDDIGKKYYK